MDTTLYKLVNAQFDFEFDGKTYRLRKATLDKAVQYQAKIKELAGDPAADAKVVAFCVYIMLKESEPTLTEDYILTHIPADIDILELLTTLGFINPTKLELARKIQSQMETKLTTA